MPLPEPVKPPYAPDFTAQLAAVERIRPKAFTSHLAALPLDWLRKFQAAGILIGGSATNIAEAKDLESLGVDFVIAQGGEAGGHQRGVYEGAVTPRAQLVPLIAEAVAPALVLGAGGIADGETLAAALRDGADGAWVGTRFASSVESYAHDQYKQRVVAAKSPGDAVITTMFGPEWPDKPLSVLRDGVVDQWAGREDQIPDPPPPPAVIGETIFNDQPYAMPKFSVILPTRDTTGDFEEMCWTAGIVSAQRIHEILPAAQIIEEMVADAHRILSPGGGDRD
jgi:enoyl-[acyl-carrier protein] reductase II